ncbi:MAG TPA: APC family permease [Candidatus Dormibacteraeota bacterium]|nr:APC family permease [Candidatus Dormibacteraeota bacterium]
MPAKPVPTGHRSPVTGPAVGSAEPSRHPRDRLKRELSFLDATMLVVSSVIGVGIFLTPGSIAELLPAPGWILAAWLVGGALSLAGALANAELGAMFPHAGGDYVYLREAYHPVAGFLAGWLSFFVIYAGTVATLAVGFAEGLAHFVPISAGMRTAVAVAIIMLTSWINYVGVRTGARVNNVTAAIKLVALAGLAFVGPLLGGGNLVHLVPLWPPVGLPWATFGLALSPVLFSYLGWNSSVYVASEIHDPHRNVPASLFVGLGVCTVVYLVVNWAYLYALPLEALRGNPRVGEAAAQVFFGGAGGAFGAALILASIVSCLNATILVGPRIAYAMALDGLFFAGVDRVHAANQTPHIAIAVQGATAIALILVLERFPSVLDYTTFAIVLATMADTTALYALRRRQPQRQRPYRAWGYPVVPALYLIANGAIACTMIAGRPLECAIALAVTATGLPFYSWFARVRV